MTVRVLINGLHAKSGGGVTYLRNMLPLLAADPELELTLFLKRDQAPLFSPIDERVRARLFDFGGGLLRLLAWEQIVLPVLAWRMGADVTFSPANYGPLLAPGPVILLRNALAVADEETRLHMRIYWLIMTAMTKASLVTSRRAVAVSEYARATLAGGDERVRVIHHGRSNLFQPSGAPKEQPPFLLAVSDLYVQKNLHGLIEALPGVMAKYPSIRLLIAGRPVDPDYAPDLRRRIALLGLDKSIVFLGGVSPEALNRLYNACAVFVFPSTVETFGNPLVEAMACGACIASSNTAAMPEILGDAGRTFNPFDRDEMTAVLLSLLDDADARADLGRRALERSTGFSWEKTAAAVAAVLKEAAAPPPPPTTKTKKRLIGLWAWLLLALGLYLWQFQSYLHSIAVTITAIFGG